MRRLMVAMAALGLAGLGLVTTTTPALAATTCTGLISGTTGSITVPNDDSSGSGVCTLNGATVKGSVTVQPGGDLTIGGGTHITGSVTADHPERVNILRGYSATPNKIDGSLTWTGSSSEATTSFICGVTIGGSLNISNLAEAPRDNVADGVEIDGDKNEAECGGTALNGPVAVGGSVNLQNNAEELGLSHATVNGSVNVVNNSDNDGPNGSAELEGNTISGGLNCSGNVNGINNGAPNDSGAELNTASAKTGQCVGK